VRALSANEIMVYANPEQQDAIARLLTAFASAEKPSGDDAKKPGQESQDDPKHKERREKLTADEDKLIRKGVYSNGPAVGTDNKLNRPQRGLAIPGEVATIYRKKPLATLRLLLKIAEGGRPVDALHAICLIGGLVEGPVYGAITGCMESSTLDDVIEGLGDTYRQRLCAGCESLIRRAEKRFVEKEKK
jgi:hypothetical protein